MEYVLAGYWATGYVESQAAVSPDAGFWVWARPYEDDAKRAAKDAQIKARNRVRWADVERALYDAVREVDIAPAEAVKAVSVPSKVRTATLRLMPDLGDTGRSMDRISDMMDAIWRDSVDRARKNGAAILKAARDEDDMLVLLMVA